MRHLSFDAIVVGSGIAGLRAAIEIGGAGQVYLETTNPPQATGDGMAMAYRATCMRWSRRALSVGMAGSRRSRCRRPAWPRSCFGAG